MRAALENKMSLKEASDFFENDNTITDSDLRRYVESMIWEIDATRDYFLELLEMFELRNTEEEFVRYLNEKQAIWRTAGEFARYALAILCFAAGMYFLLAMLQSASYSVPAPPLMSEIYKTRAMLAWPIALLFFSVGVLFFICLKPKQK
jgi:hypothetical protein